MNKIFKNFEPLRESSNLKTKKGITLIALIVTIIVLLILSGVAVVTLTGENGILERARLARENTERKNEEEKEILNSYENEINNYAMPRTTTTQNYSLEEQKVGEWIDRKPLYQRTIECNFGNDGSAAEDIVYRDSITPYDMVMIVSAIGVNAEGKLAYANLLGAVVRTNDSDKNGVYYSQSMQAYMKGTELKLYFNHGTDRTSVKPIVTIQYTKTTDK